MIEGLFEKLHPLTKAQLLWKHGEIVSERKHDVYNVHAITLYKVFNFHVEVYCDVSFNEIEDIRVISDEELSTFYDPVFSS